MVVGDFPIETDTIVIEQVLVDMLRQFARHNWDKKLLSLRKVTWVVYA